MLARGAKPQILTRPLLYDMNLRRPFQFTEMKAAKPLFDASSDEQKAIYADAGFRAAFKEELKLGRKWAGLAQNVIVVSVENAALRKYEGRTVGQIAQELGRDANDVFFDIAVDDDLNVKFVTPRANTDPVALAAVLRDSRTMIGLSDAGAHLDMLCEAGYTTYLLGYWVREQKARGIDPGHRLANLKFECAGEGDHQLSPADVAARRKVRSSDELVGDEQPAVHQPPARILNWRADRPVHGMTISW